VRIRGFWRRKVYPVLDNIDATADETVNRISGWFRRK